MTCKSELKAKTHLFYFVNNVNVKVILLFKFFNRTKIKKIDFYLLTLFSDVKKSIFDVLYYIFFSLTVKIFCEKTT